LSPATSGLKALKMGTGAIFGGRRLYDPRP
jgi:hypothetical protein